MALWVFPSHNDLGNADGDGRVMTEDSLSTLFYSILGAWGGVISGMTVSNPSGRIARVATGSAVINGRYVNTDTTYDITCPASSTNYVYLTLSKDGEDRVDGVVAQTTSSPLPATADSVLLARAVTSSSAITLLTQERQTLPGVRSGTYSGDGTDDRTISVGATPVLVIAWNADPSAAAERIVGMCFDAMGRRIAGNQSVRTCPIRWYADGASATGSGNQTINVRSGSDTWNTGSIPGGGGAYHDVSVSGATQGEAALCNHSDYTYRSSGIFSAYVPSDNTVRCVVWNHQSASISFSGTITAWAYEVVTSGFFRLVENSQDSHKAPLPEQGGFEVSDGGTTPALNRSGQTYGYVVIS